jgi:hypothetical protein
VKLCRYMSWETLPQIFSGLYFITSSLEESTYKSVARQIIAHGGRMTDFSDPSLSNKQLILLSEGSKKTDSFLLANIYEIPRLHIDYITDCVKEKRLIPIQDPIIQKYLLDRGQLFGKTIIQQIPTSLYILDESMRVFAGLTFEIHLYSPDNRINQLIPKLIRASGGLIIDQHTERDTDTTKLIVYEGDLNNRRFEDILKRALSLSIFIVNQLYIINCIIEGQICEILDIHSPNRKDLLEMSDEFTPEGIRSETAVVVPDNRAVDEWIFDLKDKHPELITGFKRTISVSSTHKRIYVYRLGDTVRLINNRIVHICDFKQLDTSKYFIFREFHGDKISRFYSKDREEAPISFIEQKVAVFKTKQEYTTRQAFCLEGVTEGKIYELAPSEKYWNEETTRYDISSAPATAPYNNLSNIEFIWYQPQAITSDFIEYQGFIFKGQPFLLRSFVKIEFNDNNQPVFAKIIGMREQLPSKSNELQLRFYEQKQKRLIKTSNIKLIQFNNSPSIIKQMAELKIATKAQIDKNVILRGDPLCYFIDD